jgi:UDPglucose--hexose-1-phosphate uridylyltransferase
MFKRKLTKPDGRGLWLYGRAPIPPDIEAVSPSPEPTAQHGHMRWQPLRGEWVAYARHRQNRTFLPPKEFNPFAVSAGHHHPTEMPAGAYDVAVFENMFPTLSPRFVDAPALDGVATMPAAGACEVVVFTQDPDASLGKLPLDRITLLLEVWADRTLELAARGGIKYVMPFENRGVEVGVTLHHPHGQIYAYPFVPPVPERELERQRRHYEATGRGLMADFVARECRDGVRLLYDGPGAAAFVPACARYPYEVWVAPKRPAPALASLTRAEQADLARALKTVLLKFDGLWQRPFPYLMLVHQAPTDGASHPEAHVYFEFCPPYRSAGKLKYLAGTELGAGLFANDSLPEEKARELQAVEAMID